MFKRYSKYPDRSMVMGKDLLFNTIGAAEKRVYDQHFGRHGQPILQTDVTGRTSMAISLVRQFSSITMCNQTWELKLR